MILHRILTLNLRVFFIMTLCRNPLINLTRPRASRSISISPLKAHSPPTNHETPIHRPPPHPRTRPPPHQPRHHNRPTNRLHLHLPRLHRQSRRPLAHRAVPQHPRDRDAVFQARPEQLSQEQLWTAGGRCLWDRVRRPVRRCSGGQMS